MVFGNLSTGYWLGAAATAGLHWQELGRTTLGSAGDTVSVGSLANKPYLMVLGHILNDGGGTIANETRFNSDSGTNYADRYSTNGGADSTNTSGTFIDGLNTTNSEGEQFAVSFINNISDEEKLMIEHNMARSSSGAGNAPLRREIVGKWANTSNPISTVAKVNPESGSYDTGSEVVVLGYDPADTEGGSVWEELGTTEGTGSEDKLSVTVDKKYLMFEMYKVPNGDTAADLQFNSDTGSNYAWRISSEGGSDVASSSGQVRIVTDRGVVAAAPSFVRGYIINTSAKEKLVISEAIAQQTAGAGTAPGRRELVGKWSNTSSAITSVDMINPESGSFASGSYLKVWGFD